MEVANGAKIHLTSAEAFVEGGSQDALGDACSICLEAFCDSDPSTVTSCKHEFHLQCVLEWCQRSSNCPMCWQAISLKDHSSQELLETVESERILRSKPARNLAIFHHPTLGDFELQHLPVGVDASEHEDQIMQHFAAAAAMGRTRRLARRNTSSVQTHPQLVLLSANLNESENEPALTGPQPTAPSFHVNHISSTLPVSPRAATGLREIARNNSIRRESEASMNYSGSAGPSELQSISDKWKSRFSSMSMKYKESISKNTREWKEKLFARSSTMAGIGSDVIREVNAGVASVSRMMERLETRENQAAPENTTRPHENNNNQETRYRTNGNRPSSFATTTT